MPIDIREAAAKYYDLQDNPSDDIPFYLARLPSPQARVLELGCGTGRVLLPLAHECGYIHGVDASAAMLSLCQQKLDQATLPPDRAQLTLGNITDFDLGRQFDLIIAPFRVLQNLATDAEVDGLFGCLRRHLAPGGTAILNIFRPALSPELMRQSWCTPDEHFRGETPLADGKRLVHYDRRPRLEPDPLVLYPELIYRLYSASGDLEDETVLRILMRCWYPAEFEDLITGHGFSILAQWGGYAGEAWGEGPELVIQFAPD
jgi:SAM-dependent methyltransferase